MSTPSGATFAAMRSGLRTSRRTRCPASLSALTVWAPMKPVPPVTSTRRSTAPAEGHQDLLGLGEGREPFDAVLAADNTRVKLGDVIMKIDDGDYRIAVDSARARIGTQEATIERIGKQVEAQQAAIDQAKAQVASAQAAATRAELELTRQQALAARDYASKQALEVQPAARRTAVRFVVMDQDQAGDRCSTMRRLPRS